MFIIPMSSAMLNMETIMNRLLSLLIFDFSSPIPCVLPLTLGPVLLGWEGRLLLALQGTW